MNKIEAKAWLEGFCEGLYMSLDDLLNGLEEGLVSAGSSNIYTIMCDKDIMLRMYDRVKIYNGKDYRNKYILWTDSKLTDNKIKEKLES